MATDPREQGFGQGGDVPPQQESPYTGFDSKEDYVKEGYGGEGYQPTVPPSTEDKSGSYGGDNPQGHGGGGYQDKPEGYGADKPQGYEGGGYQDKPEGYGGDNPQGYGGGGYQDKPVGYGGDNPGGYGGGGYQSTDPLTTQSKLDAYGDVSEPPPPSREEPRGGMKEKIKEKLAPCVGGGEPEGGQPVPTQTDDTSPHKKGLLEKVKEKISPRPS